MFTRGDIPALLRPAFRSILAGCWVFLAWVFVEGALALAEGAGAPSQQELMRPVRVLFAAAGVLAASSLVIAGTVWGAMRLGTRWYPEFHFGVVELAVLFGMAAMLLWAALY